jgi:diguanylate cyclase (GGDEF)-like protein
MVFAVDGHSMAKICQNISQLQINHIDLVEVTSFKEAIQAYRSLHPDMIIAEFVNGFDEVRGLSLYVRERDGNRHTGLVVYHSGENRDESLVVSAFEAGADDFLHSSCSSKEVIARIQAVIRLKMMTDELRKANHQLEILSMTDDLTSIANMRAFNQSYSLSFERVRRSETGLFVVMFDLDNFKSVNDTSNHLIGSAMIREIAKRIRKLALRNGIFARYGGDEYILYAQTQDPEEGRLIGERVRSMIAETPVALEGRSFSITASVGSCFIHPGYDGGSDDAIKIADLGLYESKRMGKNCVHSFILKGLQDYQSLCKIHGITQSTVTDTEGTRLETAGGTRANDTARLLKKTG